MTTTLCRCGTKVSTRRRKLKNGKSIGETCMQSHLRSKWHGVAKKARVLRMMGFSYFEVARRLDVKMTPQGVGYHLKKEGL